LCENYVVPSAPPSNETEWNSLVKVSKCQNYVVGVVDGPLTSRACFVSLKIRCKLAT
jgi:hypothetical protein